MKAKLILVVTLLVFINQLSAQRNCSTFNYQQYELRNNSSLAEKINAIEAFTRQQIAATNNAFSRTAQPGIITIPVVVHILYHRPSENVSDEQVHSQIEALNRDYRRRGADSVNTPAIFKSLAADCEIEFQLAISDPYRRSTTGIIHKYTPISYWEANDKMKFSSEMGDDAWDTKNYLNIWVCNLEQVAGYSSLPGGPENKDGVVIGIPVFGTINTMSGFDMGKTAVHEVGHWLNLKHLWGDADCGDDKVDDTPKQSNYNQGCPSGIHVSCSNGPNGDMYMNYMDFVNDACMNLFTNGQKARMRALFEPGGVRNSILSSTGLSTPLIFETPIPDEPPKWLHPKLYPNPAASEMMLDLSYDVRWIGKIINVTNLQGQNVMQVVVTSKFQKINITRLQTGMYFLTAKKEDGDFIKEKFIKF
jgi:Pregnancy-associated plasma protein-A/Secretion system C-terminal sorting domain